MRIVSINKSFLLILLYLSLCGVVHSTTTNVVCASIDGVEWEWLYDEDGRYTQIEGVWGIQPVRARIYIKHFMVAKENYDEIQQRCQLQAKFAHPADSIFSSWSLFKIITEEGQYMLTEGYVNTLMPYGGISSSGVH